MAYNQSIVREQREDFLLFFVPVPRESAILKPAERDSGFVDEDILQIFEVSDAGAEEVEEVKEVQQKQIDVLFEAAPFN